MFNGQCSMLNVNFVDFCHDSANHASMLALAAPKVPLSPSGTHATKGTQKCSMLNVKEVTNNHVTNEKPLTCQS